MTSHTYLLSSLPKVCFAHFYSTDKYEMHFPKSDNFMEITYLTEGDISEQKNGKTTTVPEKSVKIDFRDANESAFAHGRQSHFTVGFIADIKKVEDSAVSAGALPLSEDGTRSQAKSAFAAGENNTFRSPEAPGFCSLQFELPDYLPAPESDKLREKIRAIVEEYTVERKTTLKIATMILSVLTDLDATCRKNRYLNYGEERYAELCKRYVAAHIEEKISVPAIAENVGLSVGYLSGVFKRVTGQTIVEYVNASKLRLAEELVVSKGLSVKKASEACGFSDANYLSRLYKKYYGKTLKTQRGAKKQAEDKTIPLLCLSVK